MFRSRFVVFPIVSLLVFTTTNISIKLNRFLAAVDKDSYVNIGGEDPLKKYVNYRYSQHKYVDYSTGQETSMIQREGAMDPGVLQDWQLLILKEVLGCHDDIGLFSCIMTAKKLRTAARSSSETKQKAVLKNNRGQIAKKIDSAPMNLPASPQIRPADIALNATVGLKPPQLFLCGYPKGDIYSHIFPEHSELLEHHIGLNRKTAELSVEKDILIVGYGGFCDGWGNRKLGSRWMKDNFKGTVIFFNGEHWSSFDGELAKKSPLRQYQIGYEADSCQNVRVHFMAQFLVENLNDELRERIFVPEKRPINTGENFLIYTASNCVDFREEAFDRLALLEIPNVAYGGRCMGKMNNHTNVRKVKMNMEYTENYQEMQKYRFCLVMENTKLDGYITEKILMAYLAGCVPIYYGTREVFDIYNPRSFIYYDIENPEPAIQEILHLERDMNAYEKVLQEPILLDGSNTIQTYFSLSDAITPNATLKQKIREMVLRKSPLCAHQESSI
jgi:hypothetical protein